VADTLRALEHDAQSLASLAVLDASAQSLVASAERQYAFGTISYPQLLVARQQAQQSQIGLISAQAQRLTDAVALYQAIGGEQDSPP
jgi:outer membrane protein TolC